MPLSTFITTLLGKGGTNILDHLSVGKVVYV
jgi:hypothetical protein